MASTGSIENRYQFTGREWENELGLHYYRARFYSSDIGRFSSEDPVAFWGGINFYSYTANNPVNWVDPTGLLSKDFFKRTNTISGPYVSRFLKRANRFEKFITDQVISKALGGVGIPTPFLSEILGKVGGSVALVLTDPDILADPYLDSNNNWRYPEGTLVDGVTAGLHSDPCN